MSPKAEQLSKMPYPELAISDDQLAYGYNVIRGKGKNRQPLYSGYSHHVARLLVNVMPGAHLVDHGWE